MDEQEKTIEIARVYQYGCLSPVEASRPLVEEQMRAGARYYNDLIALERCRRKVYRELRTKHCGEDLEFIELEIEELTEKLNKVRDQITSARKAVRGRANTKELDAEAKEIQKELKIKRMTQKIAREALKEDPDFAAAVAALDERGDLWHKWLRAGTKAYWGSYLLVEQSIMQAKKAKVDPDFRHARGRERISRTGIGMAEGRIGVQIQGGMTVAELLGGQDTRLRLIDAPKHYRRGATSARGMRRTVGKMLQMRVGSEGRAPIWISVPMIYHRDLPENAKIKGCTLHLRMANTDEKWLADFTFTAEIVPPPQLPGVVAIDLGWRKRPDASLRVAYWVDDQGNHGEITMPASIRERLNRSRSLREIQDRLYNRVQRGLHRWLHARDKDIPEYLKEAQQYIMKWRSHARLRRLVFHWRDNRFEGDNVMFEIAERWMHKSRHLYRWEVYATRGALRARRECYRLAAVKFSRNYGMVIMEQFNLAQAKRKNAPEQGPDAPRAQRAQLHASAPGELRSAIQHAVTRDGGLVVQLDAAGTTAHCHKCGGMCKWDQGEELMHRCEHCHALWDQDYNGGYNLLQKFTYEKNQGDPSGLLKRPEPRAKRFAKRHKGAANATEPTDPTTDPADDPAAE